MFSTLFNVVGQTVKLAVEAVEYVVEDIANIPKAFQEGYEQSSEEPKEETPTKPFTSAQDASNITR